MEEDRPSFHERDIIFMVETLLPQHSDTEQLVQRARHDEDFLDNLVASERLFERIMAEDSVALRITPKLFFSVLLGRARKDLEVVAYTVETRSSQIIPVFDTPKVVELLSDRSVRRYLSEVLASFTRIQSFTWRVRVRNRVWYKRRFSDLDVDSLIRLCGSLDEDSRFPMYRRIGDVCLFMAGMFPEHVLHQGHAEARAVVARAARRNLEEYERDGKRFYRLAAKHEAAKKMGLSEVLRTLAERFTLAEKPLTFLSQRYLLTRKHTLFGL